MPVSHYNLWLAYLKKEQEQYKTKQSLSEARNLNNGIKNLIIDIVAKDKSKQALNSVQGTLSRVKGFCI